MRVTWREQVIPDTMFQDMYESEDFNPDDIFVQRYGVIVGVSRTLFGDTMVTVGCDDGAVRTVEEDKLAICTP